MVIRPFNNTTRNYIPIFWSFFLECDTKKYHLDFGGIIFDRWVASSSSALNELLIPPLPTWLPSLYQLGSWCINCYSLRQCSNWLCIPPFFLLRDSFRSSLGYLVLEHVCFISRLVSKRGKCGLFADAYLNRFLQIQYNAGHLISLWTNRWTSPVAWLNTRQHGLRNEYWG